MLWLAPVVALPVFLVVVANLLTGRRPLLLLRERPRRPPRRLRRFLRRWARFETGAHRIGAPGFGRLRQTAPFRRHSRRKPPDFASLITETERLALALLALPMLGAAEQAQLDLASMRRRLSAQPNAACARACRPPSRPLRQTPATDGARPLARGDRPRVIVGHLPGAEPVRRRCRRTVPKPRAT